MTITFHISKYLNALTEREVAEKYPDWTPPTDLHKRRRNYERVWRDNEHILSELEDHTGLKFEPHIECYVVSGQLRNFSRPLMIKSRYSDDEFIASITHELTHRLVSANKVILPFPEEKQTVRNHVITYALLSLVLTPEQLALERDVEPEDYQRAWEIVDASNPQDILSQLLTKI